MLKYQVTKSTSNINIHSTSSSPTTSSASSTPPLIEPVISQPQHWAPKTVRKSQSFTTLLTSIIKTSLSTSSSSSSSYNLSDNSVQG